jgi:hypothetical protein
LDWRLSWCGGPDEVVEVVHELTGDGSGEERRKGGNALSVSDEAFSPLTCSQASSETLTMADEPTTATDTKYSTDTSVLPASNAEYGTTFSSYLTPCFRSRCAFSHAGLISLRRVGTQEYWEKRYKDENGEVAFDWFLRPEQCMPLMCVRFLYVACSRYGTVADQDYDTGRS